MRGKSKWEISFLGWNNIMGVYCIMSLVDNKPKVYYVGSSKNIGKRVINPNHPYCELHDNDISCYIKFKEVKDIEEMLLLESSLIKKLQPQFNKKGK